MLQKEFLAMQDTTTIEFAAKVKQNLHLLDKAEIADPVSHSFSHTLCNKKTTFERIRCKLLPSTTT